MQTESGGRSLGNLIKDVIADFQDIVRAEVRLAKAEVREEAGKASGVGKMLGIGALLGLYAGAFFLVSGMRALERAMDPWLAALAVALVLAIGALVFLSAGRKKFRELHPKPVKTIESIKENLQWSKNRTG